MTNDVAMVRKFLYMIRRGRRPIILRSAERPLTVPTHTRKEHAVSDAET